MKILALQRSKILKTFVKCGASSYPSTLLLQMTVKFCNFVNFKMLFPVVSLDICLLVLFYQNSKKIMEEYVISIYYYFPVV